MIWSRKKSPDENVWIFSLYNTRKAGEFARFADMFCKSIGIVSYADVKVIKQSIAA